MVESMESMEYVHTKINIPLGIQKLKELISLQNLTIKHEFLLKYLFAPIGCSTQNL